MGIVSVGEGQFLYIEPSNEGEKIQRITNGKVWSDVVGEEIPLLLAEIKSLQARIAHLEHVAEKITDFDFIEKLSELEEATSTLIADPKQDKTITELVSRISQTNPRIAQLYSDGNEHEITQVGLLRRHLAAGKITEADATLIKEMIEIFQKPLQPIQENEKLFSELVDHRDQRELPERVARLESNLAANSFHKSDSDTVLRMTRRLKLEKGDQFQYNPAIHSARTAINMNRSLSAPEKEALVGILRQIQEIIAPHVESSPSSAIQNQKKPRF